MSKIFASVSLIVLNSGLLWADWPTDSALYVSGNYGTYENTGSIQFHDGVDIPRIGVSSRCIAVDDLMVVGWVPSPVDGSFQGVVFSGLNSGKNVLYDCPV